MAKIDEKSLHDLLKNVFGFEQFKGNQKAIIKSILAGNKLKDKENTIIFILI